MKASSLYRFRGLLRRFITCCLRFTTCVAARHARLASGWRAAPLPGGSRTRWIATRGFSSWHPPLQGLPWRNNRSVRPWHRPTGSRVPCAQVTDLCARPFTTSARPDHHGLAERLHGGNREFGKMITQGGHVTPSIESNPLTACTRIGILRFLEDGEGSDKSNIYSKIQSFKQPSYKIEMHNCVGGLGSRPRRP